MDGIILVSQEQYDRLVDEVVNGCQPVVQQSCDWFGHVPKPLIYPLAVYRKIEEIRNANSDSGIENNQGC